MKTKTPVLVNLKTFTSDLVQVADAREAGAFRLSDGLLHAKNFYFQGDYKGWVSWAKKHFRRCKRWADEMAAIAVFRAKVRESSLVQHVAPKIDAVGFTKVGILASIPLDRLLEFFAKHNAADMERDDLRDAVNAFLERPGSKDQQQDFFKKLGIPTIPRLEKLLEESANQVTPQKSAAYGLTFLMHAVEHRRQLTLEERQDLERRALVFFKHLKNSDVD